MPSTVGGLPRAPAPPPAPKPSAPSGIGGASIGNFKAPPVPSVGGAVAAGAAAGQRALAPTASLTGVPGGAQVSNFKNSPAYKQAIIGVFEHQPQAQRRAIIAGAIKNPTPEGKIILGLLNQQFKQQGGGLVGSLSISPSGTLGIKQGPSGLDQIGNLITKGFQTDFGGGSGKGPGGSVGAAVANPMFGGAKGGIGLAKNFGSDALNLVPQTVQGGANVVSDLWQGKYGAAAGQLVDPFVSMFMHPAQSFYQHPLYTGLMASGVESALGRGLGAVGRSGALGASVKAAAGTAREPLQLGGDISGAPFPITDQRSYTPNVINKGLFQKPYEAYLRKRGFNPNVSRPAPGGVPKFIQRSLNAGLDARLRRIPDEMTAMRQMAGREVRAETNNLFKKYQPKQHQDLVSFINQRVIRDKARAAEDLQKEINRLKAAQSGARLAKTFANRRQVRTLDLALKALHGDPNALDGAFAASDEIVHHMNNLDARAISRGILNADQAQRSKLFPYAQAHMGARYDGNSLVNPDGSPLSTDAILQHLEDNNVSDPSYVGHYPQPGAFWNFYQRYRFARGTKGGMARTGKAFAEGNYDHTYKAMVGMAAKTNEAVTKAGLHDAIVNRLGIGKPKALQAEGENGMFTPEEARVAAHAYQVDDHGNPVPGNPELVPITAYPKGAPEIIHSIQNPAELEHANGYELAVLERALHDAATRTDQERNVVLIPKVMADQFKKQFSPAGPVMGKVGHVTQQFRRTVLPYSVHWMTQIGSEAVFRSMIAGVFDPRSRGVGRQLMRTLKETPEGQAALREMVNATFYNRHDPLARFNPNPNALVAGAKTFPPTRALIAAHNAYANNVGYLMGGLEREFRIMGLGKVARRQVQEFTGAYQTGIRLQGQNLAMLAEKLKTDPTLVASFGRQVDDIFGKYNKLSPAVRAATQSFLPFVPWYLNAAKFVLWNLPVKHPVASALLASLRVTMANDLALGKQAPLNAYQEQAIAKFLPWGVLPQPATSTTGTAGPTPLGQAIDTAAGFVGPQVTGAYNVLHGLNVFGDAALRGPTGDVKANSTPAIEAALEQVLESLVPGARYVRLAEEGGAPAYGTSTILNPQPKPGGTGGASQVLNRIFNPFYAFQRAGTASTGGRGGSLIPSVSSLLPSTSNSSLGIPTP